MQSGEDVAAGLGAHASTQHDRIETSVPKFLGEPLHVCRPLGEHQAVPASLQCRGHVIEHLGGAGVVGDDVAVTAAIPPGADGSASPT